MLLHSPHDAFYRGVFVYSRPPLSVCFLSWMSNWRNELELVQKQPRWSKCDLAMLSFFHHFLLSQSVFRISKQEVNISAGADRTDDQYKWLDDYLATGWNFWLTGALAHILFGTETRQWSLTTTAPPCSHTQTQLISDGGQCFGQLTQHFIYWG